MKQALYFVIFAFAVFISCILLRAEPVIIQNCLVHKVIDGDTLRCKADGKEYYVRFRGVDTPEITWGKDECYGKEAQKFLAKKVDNKPVTLRLEGGQTYGRVVAFVYTNDELINLSLVLGGYGMSTMKRFPTKHYSPNLFDEAEKIAKELSIGMWGKCAE